MADRVKIPVGFPNESYRIEIPFDFDDFTVDRVFPDTVFGWYGAKEEGGIYVNIAKEDVPESKLEES